MKHPELRRNRKIKIKDIKRTRQDLNELVKDCLDDIRPYLVRDLMTYLKRRGILYVKKNKKKNKKKAQKKT